MAQLRSPELWRGGPGDIVRRHPVLTAALAAAAGVLAVKTTPQSITAVAVAKDAAAGGSILILTKEALQLMAWTKIKTTIIVGIIPAAIAVPARVHIPVPLAHPPVFWPRLLRFFKCRVSDLAG